MKKEISISLQERFAISKNIILELFYQFMFSPWAALCSWGWEKKKTQGALKILDSTKPPIKVKEKYPVPEHRGVRWRSWKLECDIGQPLLSSRAARQVSLK